MSVLGKKWVIKNTNEKLSTFDKLLENRGHKGLTEDLKFHNPFLFRDMEKAVIRIGEAINRNERIIIFGDYDVDGITGTAILVKVLKLLKANVSFRLPNREKDGYGLSVKFIEELAEKEVKLLITTDCGISCYQEVSRGNKLGIDTIITDHHSVPPNIPEAHAIIHPNIDDSYPFKGLTGAGVALKLAHSLLKRYLKDREDEILSSLLDLAAMGTVADMGPLIDENRLIVKKGLVTLKNTKWPGLKRLIKNSQIKDTDILNTISIGYRLAPRINAAGRIGDPYKALFLLLAEKENEEVLKLGNELEELNNARISMMNSSIFEAEDRLARGKLPLIIVEESPNWHVGVLGLIAGKLSEKYSRPAILMQDKGDILVGSARSPEFFNITDALGTTGKLLINFGGHAQAAGFSIEKKNLRAFKKEISKFAESKLKDIDLKPTLKIDCIVHNDDLNIKMAKEIVKLEPFGIGNSTPKFLIKNVAPQYISTIGKEKSHLRFSICVDNIEIQVIAFRMAEYADRMKMYKTIDLVFNLEINKWNNKEILQLNTLDFRESSK